LSADATTSLALASLSTLTLTLTGKARERSSMQDIFGSVRRSLVFRGSPENEDASLGVGGSLVDKISYCIRSSRVFSKPSPPSPSIPKDAAPPIRWRKGELIGCGAFGQVYVGMNLDSGELLAVKQVLIAASSASKEKAQAHIKELEEEVKLLKDLSHPNIVRYLGTVREEDTLNILLEFVPGGSISSLLGKFGAFPEAVIRTYTKQLLLGLEYLHKNGIMHRDIKGANILVDNKGCIKLADFGASKQVVELATISGAKSMKGTPYWMAPEVILQTGHSFSADIWSVGCTVIEMATGKPPWSQQYQQEVAVLFHIGTTKSHPPIPDHLSVAAKDFLLKCLQKEPILRSSASELLQHPFVTGEHINSLPLPSNVSESFEPSSPSCAPNVDSFRCCSTVNPLDSGNKQSWGMSNDDDMCVIDDEEFSQSDVKYKSLMSNNIESFNPMSDPSDDWGCKFDASPELENRGVDFDTDESYMPPDQSGVDKGQTDFSFPGVPSLSEEDDELTESKIKAFLDEKALELKKLQTPLYEEFYNSLNTSCSPNVIDSASDDTAARKYLKLPPKSRSPSRVPIGSPSKAGDNAGSPGSNGRASSTVGHVNNHSSQDIPASPINEWKGLIVDSQQQPSSPSLNFSERQRKWKEELDQELERKREMMRQAGMGGKTSSPKGRALHRQRERTRFASPSK
ncbi:Mitogen-activated protein kinase kinase kinase ANP1, partial [Mucuna pruriens]